MKRYYSVTIWGEIEDIEPWTSVFDSIDKATQFLAAADRIIAEHCLPLYATLDSGFINDTSYLVHLTSYAGENYEESL